MGLGGGHTGTSPAGIPRLPPGEERHLCVDPSERWGKSVLALGHPPLGRFCNAAFLAAPTPGSASQKLSGVLTRGLVSQWGEDSCVLLWELSRDAVWGLWRKGVASSRRQLMLD